MPRASTYSDNNGQMASVSTGASADSEGGASTDDESTPEAGSSPQTVHVEPLNVKSRAPERATTLVKITVAGLVIAGIAVRAWILSSSIGQADSDESVVGLMAMAALRGDFSTFYWGQAYGGSQEAMATALLFAVFGTSVLALKFVPILISIAAAVLLWRVGIRTVGRANAAIGAALFWSAPFPFVWITTKERGFYEATMVCGLAVILCALHLADRDTVRLKRWAALGGFAAGLGLWASPQSMYFTAPAFVWLMIKRPSIIKSIWPAVVTFVVGLFPAILFNIRSSGASFKIPTLDVNLSYAERLQGFFTTGGPMMLGLKVMYRDIWVGGHLGQIVYVAAALAGLALLVRKRRALGRPAVLLLMLVMYPFVFAISPFSAYIVEPRYLYFLSAPLALISVWLIGRRAASVYAVIAIALTVVSMTSLLNWGEKWHHHDLTTDELDGVEAALKAHGETRAFADYWVAYRITLDSDEDVTAAPITSGRDPRIQGMVDGDTSPAFVLFDGSDYEQRFEAAARSRNVSWTTTDVGQYTIYFPDGHVTPEEVLAH